MDGVGGGTGGGAGAAAVPGRARGRVRVEPGQRRVRAYLAGELVVDTVRPVLVWEVPYYPTYYLPAADVRAELVATGRLGHSPSRGDGELCDVRVPRATAPAAAQRFARSPIEDLRGLVRLDWDAMDEWLEEDEPVYVHPRDPYTRIDILTSSRHVQVELHGTVLADSRQPRILFETGLPPRYYLPLSDLRLDLLRPSGTRTQCPYKGTATYWSVAVGGTLVEDVVWTYRAPLPESQKIAGLACCYDEKVDVRIDGRLQERPHTPFS